MNNHLNLLPHAIQRKYVIRNVMHRWMVITFIATLVVGTFAAISWRDVVEKQQAVVHLESELKPLEGIEDRLTNVRFELSESIVEQEITFDSDETTSRPLLTLLATVSKAVEANKQTTCVDHLQFERLCDENRTESQTGSYLMLLKGFTLSKEDTENFVSRLEQSGRFTRVQLISTLETNREQMPIVRYKIRCSF